MTHITIKQVQVTLEEVCISTGRCRSLLLTQHPALTLYESGLCSKLVVDCSFPSNCSFFAEYHLLVLVLTRSRPAILLVLTWTSPDEVLFSTNPIPEKCNTIRKYTIDMWKPDNRKVKEENGLYNTYYFAKRVVFTELHFIRFDFSCVYIFSKSL